jgi:hypothetical protein
MFDIDLNLRRYITGSNDGLFQQPWRFFAGVAAPCVLGLASSLALSNAAGLTKPQCVSVARRLLRTGTPPTLNSLLRLRLLSTHV